MVCGHLWTIRPFSYRTFSLVFKSPFSYRTKSPLKCYNVLVLCLKCLHIVYIDITRILINLIKGCSSFRINLLLTIYQGVHITYFKPTFVHPFCRSWHQLDRSSPVSRSWTQPWWRRTQPWRTWTQPWTKFLESWSQP